MISFSDKEIDTFDIIVMINISVWLYFYKMLFYSSKLKGIIQIFNRSTNNINIVNVLKN